MFKAISVVLMFLFTNSLYAGEKPVKNKMFFITNCEDSKVVLDEVVRQLIETNNPNEQIELIDTFIYVVDNVSKAMCTYKEYMHLKHSVSLLTDVKETILSGE